MFFDSWMGILRTIVVAVGAYFSLMVLLRVSGKRTLSKMNAFDFVVTIALGSTLATTLLSKTTPLIEGILAMGLLVGLQYVITWSSVRSKAVSNLVKSEPALLFHQGSFLEQAMIRERINEDEIMQALRMKGFYGLQVVEAVVLETNGSFSVLGQTQAGQLLSGQSPTPSKSALSKVVGYER